MRRTFLIRSVQRALGEGMTVYDAAYVWSRHRWMLPFSGVVFAAVVLLTPLGLIDDWPTRIVIGAAAVAVAVTATTEYSVIAQSDGGLHLLTASKIRQVALRFKEHLAPNIQFEPVGGTGLSADWQVGDRRFTVPRSSEQAMARMAAGLEA